jgi:hypothetical protein
MIALSASARKRRYDDPDTKGECGKVCGPRRYDEHS